jgi:hypothetical protein
VSDENLIAEAEALSAMIHMGEKVSFGQDTAMIDRLVAALRALPAVAPGVRDGMDVLSALSSYLGAGCGDETTTAEEYAKRIRWGVDYQASTAVRLCAAVVERLSKDAYSGQSIPWGQIKAEILAVSPAALDAPAPAMGELVEALTNLLAAVDTYAETPPQSSAEALASCDVAKTAEDARAVLAKIGGAA